MYLDGNTVWQFGWVQMWVTAFPFIVACCSLHNFCEDLETEDPADSEVWNMQLEDDPILIKLGLA